MRKLLALLQFRRGEGEVTKLLLVDGRDHRVIDGREAGLFLREIWVKVVDVFRCFLKGKIQNDSLAATFLQKQWLQSPAKTRSIIT